MPDRLSELLHEVDDVPTALPAPALVRRRGLRLRRRRQAAAGMGALALVAVVAVGAAALAGGTLQLDPAPVVPATNLPDPGPEAEPSPREELLPDDATAPTATPPQPDEVAPGEVETYESEFGYLRGFGEREGRRTILIDRVQLLQEPSGPSRLVNENPRTREYVLRPDASVYLADEADREQRTSGMLSEVGEPSSLAELERAHAALAEGEQILLDLALPDGSQVGSVMEVALL